VEVNYEYGTTLHASNGDEEAGVHKKQGCAQFVVANVEKAFMIPHTNVI
jgi:hypothetical protein